MRSEPQRLEFLDFLRGIAALLVFAQHSMEQVFEGVSRFSLSFLQMGQCGVTIFFLCSGFVIPYTLERHPSQARFWINRVFRLYPLYWASLLAALALNRAGLFPLTGLFGTRYLRAVLVNATMVQSWVGVGSALQVYWSLAYEMGFYVAASALLAAGLNRRTFPIAVSLFAAALADALASRYLLGVPMRLELFFYSGTLFFGTLIYRYYSGELRAGALRAAGALAVATAVIGTWAAFAGRGDPAYGGSHSFVPMMSAWLLAFVAFALAFANRGRRFPAVLLKAGLISYSIYLVHPLVVFSIPRLSSPWLTLGLWTAVVLSVSALSYRWIEKPAMALGKRLAGGRALTAAPKASGGSPA